MDRGSAHVRGYRRPSTHALASPRRLGAALKAATGYSFGDYLAEFRVRNARALLDDPDEGRRRFYEGFECLQPDDIAEAIMFVLGAPQRMDVSYMEIVPTDQSYGGSQFHRRGSR